LVKSEFFSSTGILLDLDLPRSRVSGTVDSELSVFVSLLNVSFVTFVDSCDDLEKNFKDGDVIDKAALIKAGIIDTIVKGDVKILGKANLKKKFTVDKKILLSAAAKEAIEKAGGKIEKKDSKK